MSDANNQAGELPNFILDVTRKIWEERNIASLHQHYAPDIIVRAPNGVTVGNESVIAATLATLHEFPDRQLYGEDVIWCEGEGGSKLSSHRIISTATHAGEGIYGPATGQEVRYRIIADCHVRGDVIDDEWIIRDHSAIARQIGMDARTLAEMQIGENRAPKRSALTKAEPDPAGPYRGTGNDNEWGERYAETMRRIMAADLGVIPAEYDRACQVAVPGGESLLSHGAVDAFWVGLRSSFPSAEFSIQHQIGREDPLWPPRAALRWSLHGRHEGHGRFGAPTGAEVHVMGMSHAEFGPWGLRREYILFDEIAVWQQILLGED